MRHDEIQSRVREIVADVLGIDDLELTPSMAAVDVEGWDSLANVQIIVAIEKSFGIRFSTGEIASIENVRALIERIAAHLT
jgi:acyl carrier protein